MKAEWKLRFEKEAEGFRQAAERNRTRLKKTDFHVPNITDFNEAYKIKKELHDEELNEKYRAGGSSVSIFIAGDSGAAPR